MPRVFGITHQTRKPVSREFPVTCHAGVRQLVEVEIDYFRVVHFRRVRQHAGRVVERLVHFPKGGWQGMMQFFHLGIRQLLLQDVAVPDVLADVGDCLPVAGDDCRNKGLHAFLDGVHFMFQQVHQFR